MKYLSKDGLTYLWKKIKAEDTKLVNRIYPVGAIYLTYNNNNPSTFIGGTWERFGQGRVLVGEGTGNDGKSSSTFNAGSSGGHYKSTQINNGSSAYGLAATNKILTGYEDRTIILDAAISKDHAEQIANISLVQPYITVYFWKRTA